MTGLIIEPDLFWSGVFLIGGLIGITVYLWARVFIGIWRWKK